jgi:phage terminase large subunit
MNLQIKTPRWSLPIVDAAGARYLGAHGGRGSGKSHLFAEMLIERSIMGKVDAVCVREVQKSLAQSVKKLLENKINQLGVSHMFHDQRV